MQESWAIGDAVALPSLSCLHSLLHCLAAEFCCAVNTLGRGAQGKMVALGEAIWASHLQQGNAFVLAACNERLPTTGLNDG